MQKKTHKTLVLTREKNETLVFTVTGPCVFAVQRGNRKSRMLIHLPAEVQVKRAEILESGSVAAEMLKDIETRKGKKHAA